ncbi:MAG: PRC-barrel domain-containing protein [Firmicutes bacterium]|nr:PRC-barrel domain-containing protein [Bacillota bacterium]
MRKSKELLGLPVLDLQAGRVLGKLRGFLIDPIKKAVVAYTVSESRWARDDRVIGIHDVYSVGKDAVTVREARKLVKALQTFEFRRLAENRVELYNTRVLTESGQYLGAVDEFTFDPSDGQILGYYITSGRIKDAFHGRPIVSANEVLTIGKDAIIVREQVSTQIPILPSSRRGASPDAGDMESREGEEAEASKTPESPETPDSPGILKNDEPPPPASASNPAAGDGGPFFGAVRYEPGVITIRGPVPSERFAPPFIQKIDVVSLHQIDAPDVARRFRWNQTVDRARELAGELDRGLHQGRNRSNWQRVLQGDRSVLGSRDRLALLGKKVGVDIQTADGESLLNAGEAINEAVVQRAEETGSLYQLMLGAALHDLAEKGEEAPGANGATDID